MQHKNGPSKIQIKSIKKDIILAASASPSAWTIFCCFSCTARSTKKAARWASCWATCLDSTAAVYSLPKLSSVSETSSRIMLKSRARSTSSRRISSDTLKGKTYFLRNCSIDYTQVVQILSEKICLRIVIIVMLNA